MDKHRSRWQAPPAKLLLEPHEAHLWKLDLDRVDRGAFPGSRLPELPNSETPRADSSRVHRERRRIIACRRSLRRILSLYLNTPPGSIQLQLETWGKPVLVEPGHWLQFNVSHSEELGLIAITRRRRVGVDIERLNPHRRIAAVMNYMFYPPEIEYLEGLPQEQRLRQFFTLWTRKEALAKARGEGLARLQHPPMLAARGVLAEVLEYGESSGARSRWFLKNFPIAPGYAAALCVEDGDPKLSYWLSV